jgi:hypothetical protein
LQKCEEGEKEREGEKEVRKRNKADGKGGREAPRGLRRSVEADG